jgi:hypothetical protein
LLVSIAEYEKKLEELRKNNEILKTKHLKLKDDMLPLETNSSKKPGNNLEQPEVISYLYLYLNNFFDFS